MDQKTASGCLFFAVVLVCLCASAFAAPPKVLGHRGLAWDHSKNPYPENSTASVRAALAAGADGVEIDVFKTVDDVLVLAHEDPLNARHRTRRRRSDCAARISQSTWAAIAHCMLIPGDSNAEPVPLSRLEDIIDLPGLDILVIDLKNDKAGFGTAAALDSIAHIVDGYGAHDRVIVMVYTYDGLGRAQAHGLRACHKRHLLRGFTEQETADELRRLGVWGQCAWSRTVTGSLMSALKQAGVQQVPYLLGHNIRAPSLTRIWKRFGAYGVHAIITDQVADAARIRDARP